MTSEELDALAELEAKAGWKCKATGCFAPEGSCGTCLDFTSKLMDAAPGLIAAARHEVKRRELVSIAWSWNDAFRSDNVKLHNQNARLKELLREVEFSQDTLDEFCHFCEWGEMNSHAPDCRLAAALGPECVCHETSTGNCPEHANPGERDTQ